MLHNMVILLILARKFRIILLNQNFNLSDTNNKMTHSVTTAYFSGDASIDRFFSESWRRDFSTPRNDLFSENSELGLGLKRTPASSNGKPKSCDRRSANGARKLLQSDTAQTHDASQKRSKIREGN